MTGTNMCSNFGSKWSSTSLTHCIHSFVHGSNVLEDVSVRTCTGCDVVCLSVPL